jgi:hypothetical protein
VDLHIHLPIRFHGVLLNELSTGTTLSYLTDKVGEEWRRNENDEKREKEYKGKGDLGNEENEKNS